MTSKLNINWLNKCRCGNRMHTVETVRGSHVRLFEDDAVKCNSCGRKGFFKPVTVSRQFCGKRMRNERRARQ